ncbi:basic amino acid ABC transporter substrate-binding protein [Methanospirillum sp. J.3.6.1-F.2.7.3]|jgi:polar amino acid transport system substrate-binding protein|uniref:Basic amino acid ABC transporter substrate-binding protein n=1 Tax=Methanospirillum purgamenti TaxID=2834276 RepID=A0A8E7EI53_9EURY|nr:MULTISPECIES: basic amino acid ABC transporter substrate-binding protein [Methanospirillum]MDX8550587.1 basic amino acid ABC transporter substrate-binding protein [Methanospirillum hungatei]QVV89742.1 basic amino acid ABC transporter substrate-binding protein [Methanospirillum sp. J.3.6.1-F.2.7.3]
MMKKSGLVLVSLIGLVALLFVCGCTTTEQPASTPEANVQTTESAPVTQSTADFYRVGIDAAYQPFSMVGPDGKATGFDVDSMKWIAKDQGFEVEFIPIAWDGIIPALQASKIDLVYAGMTITDERKEKVNFSKPYWTVNQMVVVKEGSPITLDQVKNGSVIIGTQRGCTAAIWIDENLVNKSLMSAANLKLYDNTPLAVDDLVSGRIDAVMYDSTVMNDIIAGKPVAKIGMVETNEDFGIAVRKDDTELLEKLNAGLDKLMASPDWEALKQKYKME